MITLEIRYWRSKLKGLDWTGKEVFTYPTKKKFETSLKKILSRIDAAGYNAMILGNIVYGSPSTKVLFINDKRFNQC